MTGLLAILWGALVLAGVARNRPSPGRARAKGLAVARPVVGPPGGTGRHVPFPGCAPIRLVAGRRQFPARPRGSGPPFALGATATVVALTTAPALVPLVLAAAWGVPKARAGKAQRTRPRALEAAVPEVVDLLVLAVGAGCNVPLAVAAAGRRGGGPVATELRRVSEEVARGRRLADALEDLPAAAGEPLRPLAGVLAGCERYGTPVLPALERLADDVRLQRRRRAEAAARKVPVTLLFPLVLCILPAFALLTVAPLIAGALRELRL